MITWGSTDKFLKGIEVFLSQDFLNYVKYNLTHYIYNLKSNGS